jgi:hypothetical protein
MAPPDELAEKVEVSYMLLVTHQWEDDCLHLLRPDNTPARTRAS